jgi:citrate synthase
MIDVNLDTIDQRESAMWLTASEALARLGSKPQTLYANVSRGRIRARPHPDDSRRSLYSAEDVERLAGRRRGRRPSASVAAEAISWGEPVLTSAVSTISGGRLYYRGRDAADFAATATLEAAAALLWESSQPAASADMVYAAAPAESLAAVLSVLAARAAADAPSYGRTRRVLQAEAASIFDTLAGTVTGPAAAGQPVHERFAAAWGRPEAADLLRRVLVLLADHELNASTFAARVAVSTGASLAAGALAGLCTLTGPHHGGAAAELQALVRQAEAGSVESAVRQWLGQGRRIPAFGHRLYPAGDIRAAALLPHITLPPPFAELRDTVERVVGEAPNIDFALAATTAAFRLPVRAPLLLFTLARCVGWLAHMLEQTASGELIRPRALYPETRLPSAGME